MKRYPNSHRIDDWDSPWLPVPVRLLNLIPKSLLTRLAPINKVSLLKAAQANTGLSDFGDSDFLEPLQLLLEDLEDAKFTRMGHINAYMMLTQLLEGRLCVEDRINKNPAISENEVFSPLIITGLPRTGTTHLHNLLSLVSGLDFIPLWETLNPLQSPSKRGLCKWDGRRLKNATKLRFAHYMMPLIPRMHEMKVDLPHEELTLCAMAFRSFLFEGTFLDLPKYRPWYVSNDQTSAYAYLKKSLQVLQEIRSKENIRWILKSPHHLDQLDSVFRVFPNAKVIRTRRDPSYAVLSLITMLFYQSRIALRDWNRFELAEEWVQRLENMLRKSEKQGRDLSEDQLMDVDFNQFMKNPEEMVERILSFAKLPLNEVSKQRINSYLLGNKRYRYGKIDYCFDDFGLVEHDLRERFSFYKTIPLNHQKNI